MAQNAKPAAQKPEDPVTPKKSNKKLFVIIGVVLLLAIAGAAGWYFTKGKSGEHHAEEAKVIPPKPPIFMALDPFTVNLRSESSDQYLQMGISLKYFDPELEAKIKLTLPEIRSKILQLLTTKTASELLMPEGKNKLVKEIINISNTVMGIIVAPAKAAASAVSGTVTENQAAPAGEETAAAAPATVHKTPTEKPGVVDVLFTSFIIQ
ncbi:MAG: flagellar basal body-associated protein FliL [Gallionellaceae bacterium]|jgi:flagellar FliL protein